MRASSTFKIDTWVDHPWEEIPEGHTLARATVRKTFVGDLAGTSTAELVLTRGSDGSAAYVGLERIDAEIAGRSGTFVLLHSALADASGQHGDWRIVPGSATRELKGLSGRAEYRHEGDIATFMLDYELPG